MFWFDLAMSGCLVWCTLGLVAGISDGEMVGVLNDWGMADGAMVGMADGAMVGMVDGAMVGLNVG